MRKKLVVGNWKLHGGLNENEILLKDLRAQGVAAGIDVAVCPPYPYLPQALALLQGSDVSVGAQDLSAFVEGAYTGEVSGRMLADLGCSWAIVGHSERRAMFGDSDAVVSEKVEVALRAGLLPILCVGESLAQRNAGQAEGVVGSQIESVISRVGVNAFQSVILAYEPIWAIGTGLTASPEQAQSIHVFIRSCLDAAGIDAQGMRIIYGGSVSAANAAGLFRCGDIDGALVGGASLMSESFRAICAAASVAAQ